MSTGADQDQYDPRGVRPDLSDELLALADVTPHVTGAKQISEMVGEVLRATDARISECCSSSVITLCRRLQGAFLTGGSAPVAPYRAAIEDAIRAWGDHAVPVTTLSAPAIHAASSVSGEYGMFAVALGAARTNLHEPAVLRAAHEPKLNDFGDNEPG